MRRRTGRERWSVSAQHHIAIIDDDEAVRTALRRLLRCANHRAEAYGSGHEFLKDLDQHTPDCLVLDVQMPEMSGLKISSTCPRSVQACRW